MDGGIEQGLSEGRLHQKTEGLRIGRYSESSEGHDPSNIPMRAAFCVMTGGQCGSWPWLLPVGTRSISARVGVRPEIGGTASF